jgi:hypothetical protein
MSTPLYASGVLHNMSGRPRTPVRWSTGGVEPALVLFALGTEPRAELRSRTRAGRGAAALRAELEAAWQGFGLHGAALLYEALSEIPEQLDPKVSRAAAPAQRFAATDRALIINVLARARSCLLLPDVPLELGNAFIARTLWSDDPRLVALARQTGAEEIP